MFDFHKETEYFFDMPTRFDNLELASIEKSRMQVSYKNLLLRRRGIQCEEYRSEGDVGKGYELVDWRRLFGSDEPEAYFDMVNDVGYARVDVWGKVEGEAGMLVKTTLYTMGEDGDKKGNGRAGIAQIKKILQYMADRAHDPVTWLIDPNLVSKEHFEEGGECERVKDSSELVERWDRGGSTRKRTEAAVEDLENYPHYIMRFDPRDEELGLSEATEKGLDFVVDRLLMYSY